MTNSAKTAIVVPCTVALMAGGFFLMRANIMPQILTTILAIFWGIASVLLFFYSINLIAQNFKTKVYNKIVPYLFIGPAVLIMGYYLFIPTVRSLIFSFMNKDSSEFVGLKNYIQIFADKIFRTAVRNTLLWLLFGTGFSVLFGLIIAILADKSYIEKTAKTFIFIPMAISMVGAGVIFKFMYAFKPAGDEQIGLLNALICWCGGKPVDFLQIPFLSNFFLIAIFIWLQTGFALVVLSAALKAVPEELSEAARIDGAGEFRILIQIVIPNIRGSIISVSTTIFLAALKCFDIVYSLGKSVTGLDVLASLQYDQIFKYHNNGLGSAMAILILLAVSPVIYYNLKEFKNREVFK